MLEFSIASLLGIFIKHLFVLMILCFLEYFVCKKIEKIVFIIPSLCGLYLLIAEAVYFVSIYNLGLDRFNINVILYGLGLVIPYGSLFLGTGLIAFILSKKKTKVKKFERVLLEDL